MPVPQFIVDLRRKIGHDLLWLPGVTAVVVDGAAADHDAGAPTGSGIGTGIGAGGAGSVLLVRRSDSGQWAPVTGILEPGEQPAAGAVREVREETHVVARAQRLVSVSATDLVTHANGDRAQYLDLTFRCGYLSGRAAVGDDESLEVAWFGADALPPMHPQARARVDQALADEPGVHFAR